MFTKMFLTYPLKHCDDSARIVHLGMHNKSQAQLVPKSLYNVLNLIFIKHHFSLRLHSKFYRLRRYKVQKFKRFIYS